MNTYLALLRGINVGGKNVIKMKDLKQVLEAIGLCEVETYIQSGNVLFKSNDNRELLISKIEKEIESKFGFSVTIIIRTAEELEQIVLNLPFLEKEILEASLYSTSESLYVGLLSFSPLQEKVNQLDRYSDEKNKYIIIGKEIYLLFHDSIRDSKLANNLSKLDVPMTIRNWKTINKLNELIKTKNNI